MRFPYSPKCVAKIKTVAGRRWHPEEKYWTLPCTDGVVAQLLALFAGEPVDVEPSLRPVSVLDNREPLPEPEIPEAVAPPGLLARVHQAIRVRHYSYRTEQAYMAWIKRFVGFHGKRHPAEMDEAEVNQFLTHLAVRERVAASTQNQALAALLFLYDHVLHRRLGQMEGVVRARRPRRLPVVLTRQEVRAVLDALDGTPRLVCTLLYGAGLRLLECLRLRVKDIDFDRNEIAVRDGKGGKDRVTMLPAVVRASLQAHLEQVRRQHANDLARGLAVDSPPVVKRQFFDAARGRRACGS